MSPVQIFIILTICAASSLQQDINGDYEDVAPVNAQKFELFDWQLCTTIAEKDPGNVIISPISVKFLLHMLYEGSGGATAKELEKVLQLPKSKSQTRMKASTILRSLQTQNPNWELDIGTKIYVDKSLSPKNWFQRVLFLYYDAYIEKMNFTDTKSAADRINYWVNMVTHGRIKDMIPDAEKLDETVLLLINAIYFKGTWKNLFTAVDTFTDNFESPSGIHKVDYMTQSNYFYYMKSEVLNSQILRLPYLGKKFAMYIILPEQTDGLDELISTINPTTLRKQIWHMEETSVNIILPKFKFDYTADLKDVLQKQGIKTIFDSYGDMKGIINNKNKTLVVSNVFQKASIEVNEEGSVAAAATEMQFVNKFGGLDELFNASHPFLFFIEDETTGTILFVGKYVSPKEEDSNKDKTPSSSPVPVQPSSSSSTTSQPLEGKDKTLKYNTIIPVPKWYQFKEKRIYSQRDEIMQRQITSQLL